MKQIIRLTLVAKKSLLETFRELQLLGLTIALPLVFLVITFATYNGNLLVTHPIQVLNDSTQGGPLLKKISSLRYADNDPVFDISSAVDPQNADNFLKNGEITLWVSIVDEPINDNTLVTIKGDALSNQFFRASTLLENTIIKHSREKAEIPTIIDTVENHLVSEGPQTEFDLYAPGMITFGLLMIIPQTAMLLAREDRWKTLNRLRLSRLHSWEILGGISLAQMVIAVIQVVIVLLAAVALGFNNKGSLGLAVVVGLALCGSAIGQGLLVACFVQDDSQAANVGSTFSMIQVFLSGSFYQLPPLTIFSLAGHQIDVFDIFPATHGFRALQQVLTYGDGFPDISFRLGAALVLSMLYFALGVFFFERMKMMS